jgi:hypothetical protein
MHIPEWYRLCQNEPSFVPVLPTSSAECCMPLESLCHTVTVTYERYQEMMNNILAPKLKHMRSDDLGFYNIFVFYGKEVLTQNTVVSHHPRLYTQVISEITEESHDHSSEENYFSLFR